MGTIGKATVPCLGPGSGMTGLALLFSTTLPRWTGLRSLVVGVLGFLACLAGLDDLFYRDTTELVLGVGILWTLIFMLIQGRRVNSVLQWMRMKFRQHAAELGREPTV